MPCLVVGILPTDSLRHICLGAFFSPFISIVTASFPLPMASSQVPRVHRWVPRRVPSTTTSIPQLAPHPSNLLTDAASNLSFADASTPAWAWAVVLIPDRAEPEDAIKVYPVPHDVADLKEFLKESVKPRLDKYVVFELLVWQSSAEPSQRPEGPRLRSKALLVPGSCYWVETRLQVAPYPDSLRLCVCAHNPVVCVITVVYVFHRFGT